MRRRTKILMKLWLNRISWCIVIFLIVWANVLRLQDKVYSNYEKMVDFGRVRDENYSVEPVIAAIFYDEKNGARFSKTEAQLIGENIKRILTTRPGERVGEPDFGSHVLDYLFMPQLQINDLILEILSSINRQEPRVTANACTLISADQQDVVRIKLDLTLNTPNKENLQIGVSI